jgi:hypothetical protein
MPERVTAQTVGLSADALISWCTVCAGMKTKSPGPASTTCSRTLAPPVPCDAFNHVLDRLLIAYQGSIQFLPVLGVEVHVGRASTPELRASC